jgi:hypothetical protein
MYTETDAALLERGAALCERRGFAVRRPADRGEPDAVADPGPDAVPLTGGGPRPVAVEPLPLPGGDAGPTAVCSRLWHNAAGDRVTLFVVPDEGVGESVQEVLRPPPLVAAQSGGGARTFYHGPDRVPLREGGYAAVRTTADLTWAEEPATGPVGGGDDADRMRLCLHTGGEVVVALDGVDALDCPPRSAVPYVYRRGEDRRFHVERDGREVGVYDSVAAMRADAYVPVPMPLVPEHVLPGRSSLARDWALLWPDGRLTTVGNERE